jgi:molecular chaperone GrpE
MSGVEKLKKELEEAKKKAEEYLAGWQRSKADFSNYQKDEAKRQELMALFAAETILRDSILVLDSFDLAITNQGEENSETKRLRIIKDQLLFILKKWGLEEMPLSEGQKFDPNFHEAVETSHEEGEEGTIVKILERGYLLHARVLRPAKVKVVIKKNLESSS